MPLDQITYDQLPYTCNAMPYAHPDRLATIATLFGMTPPPVSTCRVLELGCCHGAHIIAVAHSLPEAECWGVDLSAQQIANGQATIEALDLPNITLRQMNILEIDEHFGAFDYIIAHGIYSWVSQPVQEKILHICKHHLTPNGVAYISYNTQPGWNMRRTFQDLMTYYTTGITDPNERTQQLKQLLQFLTDATSEGPEVYSQFIKEELSHFNQLPESFRYQTFLDEENHPIYFHQFIDNARSQGLEYLGDAFFYTMLTTQFTPPIAEGLQVFKHNLIHQEQMMDWLRNRHFRHTLLCHRDIRLNRTLSPEILNHFHIASSLQPVTSTPESTVQQFANAQGTLSSDNPFIQAAMQHLSHQWPRAVAFSELLAQTQDKVQSASPEQNQAALTDALLKSYSMGLHEWYILPAQFMTTVTQHPQASRLARWQAQQGQKVTNQRHETILVNNAVCLRLLPYLDGHHDHTALLELLNNWVKQGALSLDIKHQDTGQTLTLSEENLRKVLKKLLADSLQLVAQAALLVA